ncbi:MAG: UDP-N-acetylmuramoyl-tripeptide--D-alanyl-D-alanine ligase [Betaproteobacteria bacterium]|nr:UDP-N-acetylmuramoyl-tripeptide--D-alanyl-D-alanine ligase [Betaproteobacteria bacterium]
MHTDSRTAEPEDLFVALQGERFDAHAFLPQLAAQGVRVAIARQGLAQAGLMGLEVNDTSSALAQLASAWRHQFAIPMIAVTGSNGKTTLTQMLASILTAWKGEHALSTQGNFNNHIGVPLTLLRLRSHHEVAVLELGMNHPGEIEQLANWTAPTVAVVNNAHREHQEFMQTVAAVARENGMVIKALPAKGVAVFPNTDAHQAVWRELAAQHPIMDFGDRQATVHAISATWQGLHWSLKIHTPLGPVDTQLAVAGEHNVHNALAACAAALSAGVPRQAIQTGLAQFQAVAGRSRPLSLLVAGQRITLIDDTYNANPDSVKAAVELLAMSPAPRLMVLGDMGEVGSQGPAFHDEVGRYAKQQGIEHLFTLGELSQHSANAFHGAQHGQTMEDIQRMVKQRLPEVATVLVKGSRFMRMERLVEHLLATQDPNATLDKEATCC